MLRLYLFAPIRAPGQLAVGAFVNEIQLHVVVICTQNRLQIDRVPLKMSMHCSPANLNGKKLLMVP